MHLLKSCLPLQAQDRISGLSMTPTIQLDTVAGIRQFSWPDLDKLWKTQDLQWGTTSWAKACNALHNAILEATRSSLHSDTVYLQRFRHSFKSCFEVDGQSQLKLERFQTVHSLLDNELLPSMVRQTLSKRVAKIGGHGERLVQQPFWWDVATRCLSDP